MRPLEPNLFLSGLSQESEYLLASHSVAVSLPLQAVLYEANLAPRFAYFLRTGIASVVVSMTGGETAEVGMIGREGVVGAIHLLGSSPVPTNCFIQLEATALRIPMPTFQAAFRSAEEIRQRVLECAQQQSNSVSQVAGCNRLHEAEARLACWLLTAQDRIGSSMLNFTQENLAEMIGTQRTTVTVIAGNLQKKGLIRCSRGHVTIIDRENLIEAACECYRIATGNYSETSSTGHCHRPIVSGGVTYRRLYSEIGGFRTARLRW
jgi:CRP-like cAMP-binding protein